jgi:hypothetical protein
MVIAPDEVSDQLLIDYENATVYGDFEQEQVLHQGRFVSSRMGGLRYPLTGSCLQKQSITSIRSAPVLTKASLENIVC